MPPPKPSTDAERWAEVNRLTDTTKRHIAQKTKISLHLQKLEADVAAQKDKLATVEKELLKVQEGIADHLAELLPVKRHQPVRTKDEKPDVMQVDSSDDEDLFPPGEGAAPTPKDTKPAASQASSCWLLHPESQQPNISLPNLQQIVRQARKRKEGEEDEDDPDLTEQEAKDMLAEAVSHAAKMAKRAKPSTGLG